ncbi:MAG: peptide chain release factor 2 [Verrucomicrobia bacterium]|nr:peptide chain release factor 2 [Verrucomicrobiota bacterium]
MIDDIKSRLDKLNERMTEMEVIFDIATREKLFSELEAESHGVDFWNDPAHARKIIDKANQQRAVLKPFQDIASAIEESLVMVELAELEEDEAQRTQAGEFILESLQDVDAAFKKLEVQSLLSSELDASNAYLTLHAGAGGTESCDWADMLFRMYSRYCEAQGLQFDVLEHQAGDEAGIKRVSVQVSGPYAYGYLKAERGVHRLVRISPFDSNKRRHTSFAAIDVVAEISDDIDVDIPECDMRVDTFRASGAGGQHVNTTDSAVRITHIPTGLVCACQAERSQHMNRAKAMKMLRAKVYEMILDEKRKDMEKFYGTKGEIAWGSQIRSYVMQPYTMVKDHRCGVETSNVQKVLDGDIQMFIEGWLKMKANESKAES